MSEVDDALTAEGHAHVVGGLVDWIAGELRAGRDVVDAKLEELPLREVLAQGASHDHVVVRIANLLVLGLRSHGWSHVRVRVASSGAEVEVRGSGEPWRPHPLLPAWLLARGALWRQVTWRLTQLADVEPGPASMGTCLFLLGRHANLSCHIGAVKSPAVESCAITHTPRAGLVVESALAPAHEVVLGKALVHRERAHAAMQERAVSVARAAFDASIATVASLGGVARGMHVHALLDAGRWLDWACREREAEGYLQDALALLDAGPPLAPSRTLDVLDALSSVYEGLASYERLDQVLARRESFIVERFGRETLVWALHRVDRGRVEADRGDARKALVTLDEARSVVDALFGAGASLAYLHVVMARAFRLAGETSRARVEIERALASGEDELARYESGCLSLDEGDPAGAAAQQRRILADLEAAGAMWGPFAVEVQRALASCLAAEQRPREAHALFEHAAGTLAKLRPVGHPKRVELDAELARSRLRLGPYR